MARDKKGTKVAKASTVAAKVVSPSAAIANEGIRDSKAFANLMSTLIGDVLTGRVSTDVANAAVNAGGKLLKVIEMQHRYGSSKAESKPLLLG